MPVSKANNNRSFIRSHSNVYMTKKPKQKGIIKTQNTFAAMSQKSQKPSATMMLTQRAEVMCQKMVYKRLKTSNANSTNVTPQLQKINDSGITDKVPSISKKLEFLDESMSEHINPEEYALLFSKSNHNNTLKSCKT